MRWLLLILLFDVSNGGMRLVDREVRVIESEDECNREGERLSATLDYPGDALRSVSICLPESLYDE